uniref:Uncharacterized protein n=1 Tax=Heterorhabditis bacteriophora TaxID=37862 RepID=A0A1I7W715_HETBA
MCLNYQVSSGFKSPSKVTHYEWLDTTRTTFRKGKHLAPGCQVAPEAVQHLSAKRFRSVQNCPTRLPKGRWGKSQEANASAHRSTKAIASAQKSPEKKSKENSPINLLSSESSKPTVQVHRNVPMDRSTANCFTNSRKPRIRVLRTSAGSAHSYSSDEFGNKNDRELEIASGALNGTDPPLLFPLPVIYTTRPPEDCVHHFDER